MCVTRIRAILKEKRCSRYIKQNPNEHFHTNVSAINTVVNLGHVTSFTRLWRRITLGCLAVFSIQVGVDIIIIFRDDKIQSLQVEIKLMTQYVHAMIETFADCLYGKIDIIVELSCRAIEMGVLWRLPVFDMLVPSILPVISVVDVYFLSRLNSCVSNTSRCLVSYFIR